MFMPSEIARLVLGYLKDAGCAQAINVYLTENVHLSEYVACLKQGHEYPTTIAGQSLTDILQDYCKLKAAERIPKEMGQSIDLSASGQVRTTPAIASTANQVTVEKSSIHPMLMGVVNEQENAQTTNNLQHFSTSFTGHASTTVRFISTSTNTDDATESRPKENQHKKTMVDSSTQCSNYSPSNNGITSVGTLGADDILESASQASTSCSTQTPNRYALRSWSSTPSQRHVDFYSSPSSMVKSALMYNFGVETFRTPAKARYPSDTPLKDRYLDDDGTWKSPRRKNQVPRKRLSYTPLSAMKTNVSIATTPDESEGHSNDNIDVSVFIDKMLHNTALHEKIADNINKVVSHTTQATITNDSPTKKQATCSTNEKVQHHEPPNMLEIEHNAQVSAEPPPQVTIDEQMQDAVIKDIVDRTESDPVFEAFLNLFYDKHEGSSRDSQILGTCSDYTASPDTHGTPLNAVESTVPSSVICMPLSNSSETPKTVVMTPNVDVVQEPPDSSGIVLASSISDNCQTPTSQISSHYPTSIDHNMVSACQNITSPSMEVSSETFPTVSSQSVIYSQRITYLPPNSDTSALLSTTTACNGPLASVQLPSTSVLQNVAQLQYTNAPSTPSVPSGTISYFPSIVPALNQSKLPTIFFPFYPNPGSIIGPVVTTLPVPPSSGLPACITLPKENANAAPVQYFKLNLQGHNAPDVTGQSHSKSFTQVQIIHGSPSKSSAIRVKASGTNLQKKTPILASKQSEEIQTIVTPCQVPQASSFIEVISDNENPPRESSNQDCNSNLSELLLTKSTAPTVTLYGQDMEEHHMDNLSFQKLLSNTSISVAGKLIGLTPVKSSSAMQVITLSPGPIFPLANAASVPAKPQALNEAINSGIHDVNQISSSSRRPNILRQKPTKYKTVNPEAAKARKDSSCIAIKQKAAVRSKNQRTILKTLDFGANEPVQKPSDKKQMQIASKLNAISVENGSKTTPQQSSDKVENKKSPDCHIVAISRSMPVLENARIIKTTLTTCCTGSNEKSPQLTSLIQSASLLKASHQAQEVEQATSHVRTLDFGDSRNPARKEGSRTKLHSNDKSCISMLTSNESNVTKKPSIKRKSQKVAGVGKNLVKNCQNLCSEKAKAKPVDEPCRKDTQSPSEPKEDSRITEVASSSPNPKKRTSIQANLQNARILAKKSKGVAPGKVLSVMDIDKFLSGLRYEQ